MIRKLYFVLNYPRGILAYLFLLKSGAKEIVREETKGYKYVFDNGVPSTFFMQFYQLLCRSSCYRTHVVYRCMQKSHIIGQILRILFPVKKDLEIYGEIGEGFVIYHGHGTVVAPYKIGKNFSVYQGVTIGRNQNSDADEICNPIIGDNVSVYTNAVVAGGITIGDNVSIGAGAVVMKDVPANSIVIGNPCIIRTKKH